VGENDLETLMEEMEEEIARVREDLISERDYQKLQNTFENQFVNANSSVAGIAGSLATYYLLYGDTDLINSQINIYRSITREEIQSVARKYLKPNQRVELKYLPQEPLQN
jgi:predicted Zn-dependent peptidase